MSTTATRSSRTAPALRAPRSLTWLSLLLALAGLGASIYLTIEHFSGSTTLACPNTGKIDCAKVTSSEYSTFAGIPVTVLGLAFFVGMVLLMSPPAWNARQPAVRWVRWAAVSVGLLSVVYLVWAELYEIGAICLWCTGVHVITFLLFVCVLFAEALRED